MSTRPPLLDPAYVVILAGVSAALHVGKLPPALPVLQRELGMTLVQAGFLLSLIQVAGMSLGLGVGMGASRLGLKRSMLTGLLALSAAGMLGGFSTSVGMLLALRPVEGFGLLLVITAAPGLIRQTVAPERLNHAIGFWGAFMPFGTALALLAGPLVIQAAGWRPWWWLVGLVTCLFAVWLWRGLPADPRRAPATPVGPAWWQPLRQTLSNGSIWLAAVSFGLYSAQWLSVIGFLPSIYAAAGIGPSHAGYLSALAAAANIVGNVLAGRLLQRGYAHALLLGCGFVAMGIGAALAFSGVLPPAGAYVAVLVFSALGGLIPSSLFNLGVRSASGPAAITTSIGWIQQWSAAGQFIGPPLVAWVATRAGGWQATGWVTGTLALSGLAIAVLMSRLHPQSNR